MERHRNNIGLLRLVFAMLVIVGHAPELIDGDRHREPLTMVFHQLSLGELAIDGFFILSGYLITMSMTRADSLRAFLARRILRIYPAFIVAFLLCILVLGPFVGYRRSGIPFDLARMLFLYMPAAQTGLFPGLPVQFLDGAMWTIQIEFRCYLAVAALGVLGILKKRALVAWIAIALLALSVLATFDFANSPFVHLERRSVAKGILGGEQNQIIRLAAIFMVGSAFYLWRDAVLPRLTGKIAALAAATTVLALWLPHVAELTLTVFGGFALFWLSFKANLGPLEKSNNTWDISYGTYLYGWPIAMAILYVNRDISPAELATISAVLALLAGVVGWTAVEQRTKDLFRSRAIA